MSGLPPNMGYPQLNGTNPVAQQGITVYNTRVSGREIALRKTRKEHECAIGGGVTDRHLEVAPGELVFSWKRDLPYANKGTSSTETTLETFTSFNRTGKRGQTLYDLINQLNFVGVARNQTYEDDKDASNTNREYVVVIGGIWTVVNNSQFVIHPRSWLYWDISPWNDNSKFFPGIEKDKRLGCFNPYDESTHRISAKAIKDMAIYHVHNNKHHRVENNNPFGDKKYNDNFERSSAEVISNIANIVMLFGPLTDVLIRAANEYEVDPKGNTHMNMIDTAVKRIRGDVNRAVKYHNDMKKVTAMISKDPRAMEAMASILVPDGIPEYQLAIDNPISNQSKKLDETEASRYVAEVQANAFTELVMRVIHAEGFFNKRVVAQSLNGAPPGSTMDIIIGRPIGL